jgi:Family of unknown function (DUF5947)
MSARVKELAELRRRTDALQALRAMRRPAAAPDGAASAERCDLCGTQLAEDHRHLLHTVERAILCTCEPCWAMRSGDPELRTTGTRVVWLNGFQLPGELWIAFGIPVGLAFFMRSSATGSVVAFYPSPAGATESELDLADWRRLVALNPALERLETDGEALIVNRLADPNEHVIAPIDRCYELVGMIKAGWEGISGGSVLEVAVPAFFDRLRRTAA